MKSSRTKYCHRGLQNQNRYLRRKRCTRKGFRLNRGNQGCLASHLRFQRSLEHVRTGIFARAVPTKMMNGWRRATIDAIFISLASTL